MHAHQQLLVVNLYVLLVNWVACHALASMHYSKITPVIWVPTSNGSTFDSINIVQLLNPLITTGFYSILNLYHSFFVKRMSEDV